MDAFNLIFGIIMIGSFIALIIVAKKKKSKQNAQGIAVLLAAIVVIAGISIAVHNLFYDTNSKYKQIENGYAKSIAYVLGQNIAERFPKSKILVIVSPNYQKKSEQKAMIATLQEGMGSKMSKVSIEPLKIKVGPNSRLSDVMHAKDFNLLIKKNKPNIVISLVGLPMDFPKLKIWEQFEDNPEKATKLAIINGSVSKLYQPIKSGVIVAVVRYNPDVLVDKDDVYPGDYKKAFAKRYLLITPENVDNIRKKFGKKIFIK